MNLRRSLTLTFVLAWGGWGVFNLCRPMYAAKAPAPQETSPEKAEPEVPSEPEAEPPSKEVEAEVEQREERRKPAEEEVVPEEEEVVLEEEKPKEEVPLPLFGLDFFARAAERPSVTPTVPVPPNYTLAPGDQVKAVFWNRLIEPVSYDLTVDAEGKVFIPLVGILVVRGKTLAEFRSLLLERLSRLYKDISLEVTFEKLHSVEVYIVGRAQFPGSHVLHGMATVLDALLAAGGPTERGSLRHVILRRAGQPEVRMDFYEYLLKGDKSQDRRLENGDTIFIPVIGPVVAVQGEVRHPARYELRGGERLRDVLEMAGGVRATGYTQRVEVRRVVENEEQILLNINVNQLEQDPAQNILLQDGDAVTVLSVLEPLVNTVEITGQVQRPGTYPWHEGLTIADLIALAEGLKPEVYWERGEILRTLLDQVQIIPFHVRRAVEREDDNNFRLEAKDRVHIYSPEELEARQVRVSGAVIEPGTFLRTQGMKVSDLIFQAKGLKPDAYLERADLERLLPDGYLQTIPIDLTQGEPRPDLELQDRDHLKVYSIDEFVHRRVMVSGMVQEPGSYERREGMKISDLLFLAKGLRPEAYLERANLERLQADGKWVVIPIDLRPLIEGGEPEPNLILQNRDHLRVYSQEERVPLEVTVVGAVNAPGVYPYHAGMKVSDLLFVAQGVELPEAYLERAHLERLHPDGTLETQQIDLTALQEEGGVPSPDLELQPRDRLVVFFRREVTVPTQRVFVSGAVQHPGAYDRARDMRVKDLLFAAGGLVLEAYRHRANLERRTPDGQIQVIPLDLDLAAQNHPQHNLLLQDLDHLRVFRRDEYRLETREVTITGAVQRQGVYVRTEGMRLSDLIFAAGNLLPEAYLPRAELERVEEDGTIRTIPIDLRRILAGDEEADLLLADRDHVRVYSQEFVRTVEPQVTVQGAVKRPGTYPRTAGMTVEDLLFKAGGLLSYAYRERADLERILPNGRHQTIPVDLTQQPVNLELQDRDVLIVYTQQEVEWREPTVTITGSVQRPGTYERTEGMTLRDLLFRAGGVTLDAAFAEIEVARARGEATTIFRPDLQRLLAGDESQNLELQDGDTVAVRIRGTYQARPNTVEIWGEVQVPGPYPLEGRRETLSHLIERAGGLTEDAYLEGAILLRRTNWETTEEQRRAIQEWLQRQEELMRLEYEARLAQRGQPRSPTFRLPALPSGTVPAGSEVLAPLVAAQSLQRLAETLSPEEEETLAVGMARAVGEIGPYVRIHVDFKRLLETGEGDIELLEGDIVRIPRRPTVVFVWGAVNVPVSVPYQPGQKLEYYIERAGGYASDANKNQVIVVRYSGIAVHRRQVREILPGDVIVVPPKAIVIRPERTWVDRFDRIMKTITGVLTPILLYEALRR